MRTGGNAVALPPCSFHPPANEVAVHADARAATVGKNIVMMSWEGRMSNYQTHNGMTVPLTGEVAWVRPEGRQPYWRGLITSLRYEFAS